MYTMAGYKCKMQKNMQKLFAEKVFCDKKKLFEPVLHFLFYKNFCISYQKTGAFKKPNFTKITGTTPISLKFQKFQISIKLELVTHIVSKFHPNPSNHLPVALSQKKAIFLRVTGFENGLTHTI